ncbi:hypothetical protein ABTW51_09445 [Serratia nematodiphila]
MQKVGSVTETADSNGEFTNGNVAQGIPPTILKAEIFNTWQREMVNIVTSSGMVLDPEDDAQIYKAIKKLLEAAAAVTSVNEKTGAVVLGANDVSALPISGGELTSHLRVNGNIQVKNGNFIAADASYYLSGSNSELYASIGSNSFGDIVFRSTVGNAGFVLGGQSGVINIDVGTGYFSEQGQRVYSPNNPPPITSQAVTGTRLSGRTVQPDSGGRIDLPAGCVFTGMSGSNYAPATWSAYSALQVNINGVWATVATV